MDTQTLQPTAAITLSDCRSDSLLKRPDEKAVTERAYENPSSSKTRSETSRCASTRIQTSLGTRSRLKTWKASTTIQPTPASRKPATWHRCLSRNTQPTILCINKRNTWLSSLERWEILVPQRP